MVFLEPTRAILGLATVRTVMDPGNKICHEPTVIQSTDNTRFVPTTSVDSPHEMSALRDTMWSCRDPRN